jgi:hypothetical protein
MRLKLVLTTAIVGIALALPSASSAAPPPPPTQDSVVLTGGPALVVDFFGQRLFNLLAINARSGPSGENPTGEVAFEGGPDLFQLQVGGPVTCLAVGGNTATFNFRDQMDFAGFIITVQVVDSQPDTFTAAPIGRAPTDCSPTVPLAGGPLSSGDITVIDAQPLPTTKDQCTNGGWEQIGFKNQGRCIAFVNLSAQG